MIDFLPVVLWGREGLPVGGPEAGAITRDEKGVFPLCAEFFFRQSKSSAGCLPYGC